MATTEIFRDRERGIPRYFEFRRLLNLPEFKTFADVNPNKEVQQLLASIYKSPEDIDLLVGTLAEEPRPVNMPSFNVNRECTKNLDISYLNRTDTDSVIPHSKFSFSWLLVASLRTGS